MPEVAIAIGLGLATGLVMIVALRLQLAWLGWLMLGPLPAAVYLFSPTVAALAGLAAGALYAGVTIRQMHLPRPITVISTGVTAASWGLVAALAAWLWPDGVAAWGAVLLPAAALVLVAVPRVAAPQDTPAAAPHASSTPSCARRPDGCLPCTAPGSAATC